MSGILGTQTRGRGKKKQDRRNLSHLLEPMVYSFTATGGDGLPFISVCELVICADVSHVIDTRLHKYTNCLHLLRLYYLNINRDFATKMLPMHDDAG